MKPIKNDRADRKLRLRAETLAHVRQLAKHELRDVHGGEFGEPTDTGSGTPGCGYEPAR